MYRSNSQHVLTGSCLTFSRHVFFFGTSGGFVGYVKWTATGSRNPTPTQARPRQRPEWTILALWSPHSRTPGGGGGVTHLTPRRLPSLPIRRFPSFSQNSRPQLQEQELAFVSGAEDGSLALVETRQLSFRRVAWDPSPVLCVDFLQVGIYCAFSNSNTLSSLLMSSLSFFRQPLSLAMPPAAFVC